eukprot:TRINITY_DN4309_c1_g1_i2.p1 TRINITY_DN4309_c1_g1~~TRINITY_DN4309_c1_g1_i2.p1  ORF type:complete len:1030 (+),score=167.16 TRINITY_DN4309_c1_g1_i2:169-3258(+)
MKTKLLEQLLLSVMVRSKAEKKAQSGLTHQIPINKSISKEEDCQKGPMSSLIDILLERESNPSRIVDCPDSMKLDFANNPEWVTDASLMILQKAVSYAKELRQKEETVEFGKLSTYQMDSDIFTKEILLSTKMVDPEVLLRNIAVRRPISVRRLCKEVADQISDSRKVNQVSSTKHDDEKPLSLHAHLGYCELYERPGILKQVLQKSHCLAAPRFITQKDILTLTLMLQSYKKQVNDDFLTCTEAEAFLALRIISNWFASYMHPFSLREIPPLGDEMVVELLKSLDHIFNCMIDSLKDDKAQKGFLREAFVLTEDLVSLKGMPVMVLENVDFSLLVKIAYLSDTTDISTMAWAILARCSEVAGTIAGSEKLARLYFTPEYKLINSAVATVKKSILETLSKPIPPSGSTKKDVLLACGTILANLSQGGPVACQELLQNRSLLDFVPEYLNIIITSKYSISNPDVIHCASVLAGNLLVWYDTVSLGSVILKKLIELSLLLIKKNKATDYWKILEGILSSISLSLDSKYLNVDRSSMAASLLRALTNGIVNKGKEFELIKEIASSTRLSVKPPCIALLSITRTVLPKEAISELVSKLPSMWSVAVHQKNSSTTSLPLITSLIYTVVPLMEQVDLFQCLPLLFPVLLDYLSLKAEQPVSITEAGATIDPSQSILKAISAFTKTSDVYTLTFAWRCCGKASGLTLGDILMNTSGSLPKGRLTYKSTCGLQILADIATQLPSACAEIRNWKPELLDGVMEAASNNEWKSDANAQKSVNTDLALKINAIRFLAGLALFDKDLGLRISENPKLINHITSIVSDHSSDEDTPLSILGASLLANVLSQQTGGSDGIKSTDYNNIQRVFDAHEADSTAADRFSKEFGWMTKGRGSKKPTAFNPPQDPALSEGDWWKDVRKQHGDYITMIPPASCAFCSQMRSSAENTFINCTTCNMVAYCSTSCREYHLNSVTGNPHSYVCADLKETFKKSKSLRRLQVSELSAVLIILYYLFSFLFWSSISIEETKTGIVEEGLHKHGG